MKEKEWVLLTGGWHVIRMQAVSPKSIKCADHEEMKMISFRLNSGYLLLGWLAKKNKFKRIW